MATGSYIMSLTLSIHSGTKDTPFRLQHHLRNLNLKPIFTMFISDFQVEVIHDLQIELNR